MTTRMKIDPDLLRWAIHRSGRAEAPLARAFPNLNDWLSGTKDPTLKQVESFAKATYTPVGFFFLPKPPLEKLPIPDLRTVGDEVRHEPSADLLETVYHCQERQEWYREFLRGRSAEPLEFVGSATLDSDVVATAASIRQTLAFEVADRRDLPTWTEALRRFAESADSVGVLVMFNGVVGSNTTRKLDPHEFRGFALADRLAPLVFINGADSKAAQIFTLAHELAHIWLGDTAISNASVPSQPAGSVESWCNRIAAEVLVPMADFLAEHRRDEPVSEELGRLARLFKVSTLVILRRIRDAERISERDYWRHYVAERERVQRARSTGGDFYRTQKVRLGERFARAVVISAMEGQTLYRDAYRLLGVSKAATFDRLGRTLGVY